MTTLIFDTFVKELMQAGMSEEQAEVLAQSQAALIAEKLATKQDLKEMEVGLKREMHEMEMRSVDRPTTFAESTFRLRRQMKGMERRLRRQMKGMERRLRRDMQELKHDLTVRLGFIMVVAIGVVVALVKLL